MTVRLLSYNVRYDLLDSGEDAWKRRRDGVASVIRFHEPDLVCLQEVWQDQLADLRSRLRRYEWVHGPAENGEHTPIAYRPDRFSVLDRGAFSLSETPADLQAFDWDAAIPRVTTTATLRDDVTAERFSLLNTHFDHQSEEARARSAELLADRVDDRSMPTVLAGDLNCTPDDEPYRTILDAGLEDARDAAESPHGPTVTFNDFQEPQPDKRIDHVFVDDAGVERFGVLTDLDARGRYPSDHFAVLVEFGLA